MAAHHLMESSVTNKEKENLKPTAKMLPLKEQWNFLQNGPAKQNPKSAVRKQKPVAKPSGRPISNFFPKAAHVTKEPKSVLDDSNADMVTAIPTRARPRRAAAVSSYSNCFDDDDNDSDSNF